MNAKILKTPTTARKKKSFSRACKKLASSVDSQKKRTGTSCPTLYKTSENINEHRVYAPKEYENDAKIDRERSNTLGFMSHWSKSNKEYFDSCIQEKQNTKKLLTTPTVVKEVVTLLSMYPSFPRGMLLSLLHRYDGNSFEVSKCLLANDWKQETDATLLDSSDVHFTTPYYHGEAPSKAQLAKLFQNREAGSFITFYRSNGPYGEFMYYLCFKKQDGLVEKAVRSPEVPQVMKLLLGLTSHIKVKDVQYCNVPCLNGILNQTPDSE